MRPPALAVVLALCCVLAGCNTFAPGQTGDRGAVPTVTPAEVPRDMAGGTVAPGLTEEGIVDGRALVAAHARAVANRSLTLRLRYEQRRGDETTQSARLTHRFGPNRTTSVMDARIGAGQAAPYDRSSSWTNATTSYQRTVVGNTTTYQRQTFDPEDPQRGPNSYEMRASQLTRLLDRLVVDDVTYAGSVEGVDVYRVDGRLPETGQRCDRHGGRQVAGQVDLVVDENGFVRGYERTTPRCIHLEEPVNGTVVEETLYERGGDTLDRPDWVADARETIANREYVAPGVTTERVVAPDELSETHRRFVRNTPLRSVEERGTVVDGERATEYTERTVRGTSGAFLVESWRDDGNGVDRSRWSNGSVGYIRERGEETRYFRQDRMDAGNDHWLDLDYRLVYAAETTVTPLDDGRYRVTARGLPTVYYGVGTSADVPDRAGFVRFVVNESGFVSQYERERLAVDHDEEGERVVRRYVVVRYSDLGTATVERPDWIDDARNATATDDST
ncbi:hypothetical protein [Halomarina rubra]|uniref:Lipoprotein n=1 Tax=Halomarina rubra TaxID=2071873 RepID=A0ABD6ATN0_9EURY|nr:hypothetical protein [Halomarina rubra]